MKKVRRRQGSALAIFSLMQPDIDGDIGLGSRLSLLRFPTRLPRTPVAMSTTVGQLSPTLERPTAARRRTAFACEPCRIKKTKVRSRLALQLLWTLIWRVDLSMYPMRGTAAGNSFIAHSLVISKTFPSRTALILQQTVFAKCAPAVYKTDIKVVRWTDSMLEMPGLWS